MEEKSFDPLCELDFTDAESKKKLTVRLGLPIFDPVKNCWYCENEVAGLEEGKRTRTYGDNKFQAIILSLLRFRIIFEKQIGDFRSPSGEAPHMLFAKDIPWVYGSVYTKGFAKWST